MNQDYKQYHKKSYSVLETGYLIVFVLVLIIPLFFMIFNLYEKKENHEKRELAQLPKFSLNKSYAIEYEQYFNENFGLRDLLIKWNSQLKINVFRSSPKPDLVRFGKNQFLFYNSKDDYIVGSYSNTNLISTERLKSSLNKLQSRKNKLEAKGIKYLIGFWPNKHTIYPEYLPFSMAAQKRDTISLADQMLSYFRKNNFSFFDVRKDMVDAKLSNNLYRKFDTHWNSNGAFYAYQSFFKQTFSALNVHPFPLDSFNIIKSKNIAGDLTFMLGVDSIRGYSDTLPEYEHKSITYKLNIEEDKYSKKVKVTYNDRGINKKILVFRDSYTSLLIPFISLHFSEVYYVWSNYDSQLVNQIKPDCVISCKAERYLELYTY